MGGGQNSAYRLASGKPMKRTDLFFSGILVPLDYLALVGAGILAYRIRVTSIAEFRPLGALLPFSTYLQLVLGVAVAAIAVLALSGLYSTRRRGIGDELVRIFVASSTAVFLVILLIFFQRALFSSRFILVAAWGLAIVTISLVHLTVRGIQRALFAKGIGVRPVAVVGQDRTADILVAELKARPEAGFAVIERMHPGPDLIPSLTAAIRRSGIAELWLADPQLPHAEMLKLVAFAHDHHLTFRYAADLFGARATHVHVSTVAGVPVIELRRTPLEGWGRILKRAVDFLGSAVAIVLLSPIGLLTAVAVRLDTRGPIFVALPRVGENGRTFPLFKFRSMVVGADRMKRELLAQNERTGPLFKMKHDPRRTRVGPFIRRFSLDELPQFLNVFRGEMSLVGPRPHEPEEVARYTHRHRTLLAIKPGITGMAQVSGRAELDFEDEASIDTYYIENWSLSLDLSILARTPFVVLSARAAH